MKNYNTMSKKIILFGLFLISNFLFLQEILQPTTEKTYVRIYG